MIPVGVLASSSAVITGDVSYVSGQLSPQFAPKQSSYTFEDVPIPAGMDIIALTGFRNNNNTSATGLSVSSGTAKTLWTHRSWFSASAYRISAPVTETLDITVNTDVAVDAFSVWLYAVEPSIVVVDAWGLTNPADGVVVQTLDGGCAVALCNRASEFPSFVGVSLDDSAADWSHFYAVGSNLNTDFGSLSVSAPMYQYAIAAVSLAYPPDIPPGTPVYDSFTRRNNTLYLAASDSGHLWEQASTGVVGINGNQAYRASGTARAQLDFGQQDMEVSAVYASLGSWTPTLHARLNADGTGGYSVVKQNSTAVKLSGYGTDHPITAGDRVGLRVFEGSGVTHVRLLINGVVKTSWTDSTAGRPSGTYAGFGMGNDTIGRLDDFSVETPA